MSAQAVRIARAYLPSAYLPADLPAQIADVIARARGDLVEVVEVPLGSNRGPDIDDYNRRAGVPLGSWWCASAVGAWWEDANLPTPSGRASCDHWLAWAKGTNRWSARPALGAAVLYGKQDDATHIGLIVRIDPLVLSIEGNTTIESGFNPNGIAVALKIVDPKTDPVLGYVLPFPVVPPPAAHAA